MTTTPTPDSSRQPTVYWTQHLDRDVTAEEGDWLAEQAHVRGFFLPKDEDGWALLGRRPTDVTATHTHDTRLRVHQQRDRQTNAVTGLTFTLESRCDDDDPANYEDIRRGLAAGIGALATSDGHKLYRS